MWEQLRLKLRSISLQHAGHSRPNPTSSKRPFSLEFYIFVCYRWCFVWSNVPHVVSPLGPSWCEAVATVPKLRHFGRDFGFYVITRLQFGTHVDRFAPNFSPTWPLGANLGSSWVQDSATWPSWHPFWGSRAQPGQFCGLNVTRWKLAFLPLFPTSCGFDGDIGPNFRAKCLHTGPSWAYKPQLASKHAQVAPCWTLVGLKLGPSWGQLASSWAQDAPLRPIKAKDGQVWPSRLLVGPSRSPSFLSVLFPGCGRFSSRSDSNMIIMVIDRIG